MVRIVLAAERHKTTRICEPWEVAFFRFDANPWLARHNMRPLSKQPYWSRLHRFPMTPITIESIAQQLAEITAKSVGKQPSDMLRDVSLREQGVDSLGFGELVFEVEDTFGVEIANQKEVFADMETINAIALYIFNQQAQK
jgi:acyl carrier protein